jgi:hypothetical protein
VLKHARARAEAGDFAAAGPLFDEACAALSGDDGCRLWLGRAALEQAKRSSPEGRETRLATARAALGDAARLRPLDPDHAVNLARYEMVAAGFTSDMEERRKHWRAAAASYSRALALFPGSAPILQEAAIPVLLLGDPALAQARVDAARALDPSLPPIGSPPRAW